MQTIPVQMRCWNVVVKNDIPFFLFQNVVIIVVCCCICQPDGISITLLVEDVYCTKNFICSSLFLTKVHEKFVYQRKRSFSCLLLLMCGDVEKCPGLTRSNVQDLFKQKGLKVFHQYIQGLFHNIAKLSYLLHTQTHTYFLSVKRTSIIQHQHSFSNSGVHRH